MAKDILDEELEKSKGLMLFLGLPLLIFVISGFLITGIKANPTITNFWILLGKFALTEDIVLSIIWTWALKSGTGFKDLLVSFLAATIIATIFVALCNILWVVLCAFSA
jgi:hypothetical protein